jgi:hypothetical protein
VALGGTWFLAYGVAGLGLGGMCGLAAGLYVHHARRSRVAAYALAGGSHRPMDDGPALLGGVVEARDDEELGPIVWSDVEVARPRLDDAPSARGSDMGARPFTLRLPSGAAVRVEPEEGRWSLDTTFVPVERGGRTVYTASIRSGDELYVHGFLQRENDRRAAGRGYRDAARASVLRGELAFCSAAVVAAHAARARFHGRWASLLALAFAGMTAALWQATRPGASVDIRASLLAVHAVAGLAIAYWVRADATAPWVRRRVR